MLIFISYPRELKESAEKLGQELRDRKFRTFLDVEQIDVTDVWKVKIEKKIKEASIFVVLYDPEAAKQNRYFLVELDLIKDERKKNEKKIITVIFPPTKSKDLPPDLSNHQFIEATTNGYIDEGSDDYWIHRVIKEAKRIEGIRVALVKELLKKIIFPIFLIILLGVFVNIYFKLVIIGESSENVCESLKGSYHQQPYTEYIYIDKEGIKAMSHDGSWTADSCEPGKQEGEFILKGEEKAAHKVEIKSHCEYKQIATSTFTYTSEVTIGKDGKLHSRKISYPLGNQPDIQDDIDDKISKSIDKDDIKQKLDKYRGFLTEKLRDSTMKCTATMGKNTENLDVLAFICPSYIRVMVKDR